MCKMKKEPSTLTEYCDNHPECRATNEVRIWDENKPDAVAEQHIVCTECANKLDSTYNTRFTVAFESL